MKDGENSASSKESAIVHVASSINGDDSPLAPSDEMDQIQFEMVQGQENRLEDSEGDGGDEGDEGEEEDDDEEDGNSVDEENAITDHADDNFGVEAIRSKRVYKVYH